MAAVREEYLEYRERVDDEMSRSRLKISELKDQLANFDTSFSKDMSKSMFIESSFKTKAQGFGTFDSREALEGVEKFTDQHFTLDSRKPQVNQIQLHDNDDDDNEEDNEDEYLARNENIQAMRDLGSPIEEERTVENLNQNSPDQYRIIKETYETLGRLKQQTLNDIGNLQYKKQEYSSIEKHFKDKVVEVSETDEMIKQEINEVKERLEILKVIKIREKQMSAKNKKKWLEAMRQLQNKITTLKTKEKELNVQLQSIRQEAEDFHTLQMKKFKQVLRETELAHEKVAKERLAVGDRLEEAEEEAGEIEIKIEFAEDQGKLKRMQVEELTERISMLKADIARFEKEHSDLIASYNVKRNLEKQMKELEDKISKMQLDVNEMEEAKINKQMRIDLAEQEIEKQKNAINRIDETIKLTKEENEIAIKKIEVYFNRKRRETEMDSPGYTVQASLRRFDTMKLSDEIRVEEGSVVASKKNELLSNVKRTIDVLAQQIKEKAIDLRHTIETIKSHEKHRGNSNEDWKVKNALQTKFQDLTKEFWDLKMKKIKTELRLKHREMTIDRFVEEQNSLKPELERTILYNMKHLPFDNEIAEHVIDEKIRKPGCISPEENIERVVSDFYDMVRDREQKIQNLYEKRHN
jgi:chromosome segregation ATPase